MILPETWVARDILRRHWGINVSLSLLSMSDNGCAWVAGEYVVKASPLFHAADTYKAWNDAGRLCENAVTIWPTRDGRHWVSDGQWLWTVQCLVNGRGYNVADAELVARQMRTFTLALDSPSRDWVLPDRKEYYNLSSVERAAVNNWLISNPQDDVALALSHLTEWYVEGLDIPKENRIVHYDLHPGNCLIDGETVVFLDPTLTHGNWRQSVCFAASRFCPSNPAQFLALMGVREDWRSYVRRETVMRVNFILREIAKGGMRWRQELRKHLDFLTCGV